MALLPHLRELGLKLRAQDGQLLVEPKAVLTDDLRAFIREHKTVLMEELAHESTPVQEAARQNVIARLEAGPGMPRAFATRFEGDLLIVSLAVRGAGTCELTIPAERVTADDWTALLACLDKPAGCA